MSGSGQRFQAAGYRTQKPLIEVDGRPMIEHVVNLFKGERNFIFICNSLHMKNSSLKDTLRSIAPSGKIVEIDPHKYGPVYAVTKVFDLINEDEEVIVNYCDFSKYWDYSDFLGKARAKKADGAISAYRGFHPHMLGTTNYAFIREKNNWMLEIREKQPFTNNRMQEFASDGTYYFKKGLDLKKYFKLLMDEDINVNGEFYVSMVYNLMNKDSLKIYIYEIEHMLQWGTPRDLQEYQRWSDYFARITKPQANIPPMRNSINLLPLAGKGSRFIKQGHKVPKPLIKINDKPMIIKAASFLPKSDKYIFACRGEHLDQHPLENEIRKVYPDSKIVRIDEITEGQACTCEIGLKEEDLESSLLIAACDNGMLWDRDKYQRLISAKDTDAVVWSFRHHPASERNPEMYGWIKVDERQEAKGISVKVPISDNPYQDHAVVGTFYFKKAKFFIDALERLRKDNIKINGEFYVDSCVNELIKMGRKVKVFEVDSYICWGTPVDLKTYEYWQHFFGKCDKHVYGSGSEIVLGKERIYSE
ncbi:MAG: NTP transferase domain-containing protein [Candidatus Omnitrophica bacterium]|nr:NTP transferase domain-containing protein [Candidatus Omnitrophota bacterium]